ncbi:MAG: flagellar basal-body MS-ring/collar protein FliF [Bryobacteraceae bacterium]|nr:flagellar basal-body MS-ring/collar protein FliF [Bryobacteraceae bacterium]
MEQLTRLWNSLSWKQRASIAAALIVAMAAVWGGVRWNRQRDLRPLFTNMAAEDAGAIVEKLRQSNVPYQVSDNGTILVPSGRVAELRIEMAAAGLPRTGRIGFELFDQSNLGVTEFAEQVNYRRALEGELERSVMALSEVERARVHVTFAKDSLFAENRQPAKASVMVKLRPGARLSPQNVAAIQHLTASAVEGLDPAAVSVLDMSGNLLSRPALALDEEGRMTSAMLEFRQSLEKEYLAKIRSTLDPLLGPERYRAGVSVECDFSSGEQSEETFDPSKSVMVTSARTEDVSGAAAAAGVPGTASNLPRPAPRVPGSSGGVSRKTENITYQTSRVVRHLKLPQGTVRRLSVAVLIDQRLRWEGAGARARRVLEPPAPETLKVVRDVLAGVVGFQQERGDQILVESLPFESTLQSAPPPEPASPAPAAPSRFTPPAWARPLLEKAPLPVWLGAGAALLAVLALAAWLLLRRLLRRARPAATVESGPAAIAAGTSPGQIPAGEAGDFEQQALAVLDHNRAEKEKLEKEALQSLQLQLPPQTKKAEVLRKVIAEQVRKDPAAVAQLVRTWITENR